VAVPTNQDASARAATVGQQISVTSPSKSGPTTVLDTIGAAGPPQQTGSLQGFEPAHFASSGGVTSPSHISLQAANASQENWSTTVIAPQQAVAQIETVATIEPTIVAATAAAATETTDDKTDTSATASVSSDAEATAGATAASPAPVASQPTTVSATPTVVAGNSLPGNAAAASPTGGGGDGNPITSGVDRARFVQRVARAFQTVGTGGGSVRLRLSPPELGSVRLEISVKNGVLTAHAQTETAQARDALVDNLPALRVRLAEQNIQIDHFDVDLFDSSGGGTSNQSQGNADNSPGFTPTAARMASKTTSAVTAAAQPSGVAAAGVVNGGLNVVI